jgi:glycosyltransferase involved in cell wall biosynthesis
MIVFSKVISNIFCKIYPQLENKIKIIPHEVRNFDKVIIPEHKGINIAMLGNISLKQKGADIIRGMSTQISNYKNVQLIVIGSLHNPPHNIKVTGKYQHSDLPRIVMKEKIDLVFIPSICPETFSYTTSEAISMGLPVACYNIGAPAERVKKYEKGVVLNNMNVAANLYELVNFVKKIRKV